MPDRGRGSVPAGRNHRHRGGSWRIVSDLVREALARRTFAPCDLRFGDHVRIGRRHLRLLSRLEGVAAGSYRSVTLRMSAALVRNPIEDCATNALKNEGAGMTASFICGINSLEKGRQH